MNLSERNRKVAQARRRNYITRYGAAAYHDLMSNLGRRGYQRSIAKGALAKAGRAAAEWRKAHPSELTKAVLRLIEEEGLTWELEYEVNGLYLDIVIGFGFTPHLAIEVNGRQHYEPCFGENEQEFELNKVGG